MNGIRADIKEHLDKKSKMVSVIEVFNKFCISGGIFHGLSTRFKMEIKGFLKIRRKLSVLCFSNPKNKRCGCKVK